MFKKVTSGHGEHEAAVRTLVAKGALLNETDKDGNTPAHIASFEGNINILDFLTSSGSDNA